MTVLNKENVLLIITIAIFNFLAIGSTVLVHNGSENVSTISSEEIVQKELGPVLEDTASVEKRDNDDMDVSHDMSEIYLSILLGKYNVGKNILFQFEADGTYCGYFDDSRLNVSGYSYTLEYDGTYYLLHIFNENKTEKVTYYVTLTDDASIVLKHPQSDVEINLENES